MKKAIALLMAITMVLSFAACGSKKEEETTATTAEGTAATQAVDAVTAENETTTEGETEIVTEVVTDKSGEAVTGKNGEKVTKKTVVTTKKGEKTTKNDSKKTTAAKVTAAAKDSSKWSTAEVLSYYKTATAKVVSTKPGFKKTREAKLNSYDAGVALNAFKSVVLEFIGVGEKNKYAETVKKGSLSASQFQSFNTSRLTTSDVKSAKCVKSGSNYIVTINVKDGSSSITGGKSVTNNSPIDKTVINIGNKDRSEFDHKTAQIVYDAIDDFASGAVIKETTNNGVVVATINASTGNISKVVVTFNAVANLSKIVGSKATLNATTTVVYSNFGW